MGHPLTILIFSSVQIKEYPILSWSNKYVLCWQKVTTTCSQSTPFNSLQIQNYLISFWKLICCSLVDDANICKYVNFSLELSMSLSVYNVNTFPFSFQVSRSAIKSWSTASSRYWKLLCSGSANTWAILTTSCTSVSSLCPLIEAAPLHLVIPRLISQSPASWITSDMVELHCGILELTDIKGEESYY